MTVYIFTIPYSKDLYLLSWEHICFGIRKGFLKEFSAVLHACQKLAEGESSEILIELASLSPSDDVWVSLNEICPEVYKSDIVESWAIILLDSIYEDRDRFSDPLFWIEELYSQLNYPEILRPFLRSTPFEKGEVLPKSFSLDAYLLGKISEFLRRPQE